MTQPEPLPPMPDPTPPHEGWVDVDGDGIPDPPAGGDLADTTPRVDGPGVDYS